MPITSAKTPMESPGWKKHPLCFCWASLPHHEQPRKRLTGTTRCLPGQGTFFQAKNGGYVAASLSSERAAHDIPCLPAITSLSIHLKWCFLSFAARLGQSRRGNVAATCWQQLNPGHIFSLHSL